MRGDDVAQDLGVVQRLQAETLDHVVDDLHAFIDVAAHDGQFLVDQAAAAQQDGVGNSNLADVVQGRELEKIFDVLVGEFLLARQFQGNHLRKPRHAVEVLAGPGIAVHADLANRGDGRLQGLHGAELEDQQEEISSA